MQNDKGRLAKTASYDAMLAVVKLDSSTSTSSPGTNTCSGVACTHLSRPDVGSSRNRMLGFFTCRHSSHVVVVAMRLKVAVVMRTTMMGGCRVEKKEEQARGHGTQRSHPPLRQHLPAPSPH